MLRVLAGRGRQFRHGLPLDTAPPLWAGTATDARFCASEAAAGLPPHRGRPKRWRRSQLLELQKEQFKAVGMRGPPPRSEVSPQRKHYSGKRLRHRHGTDLEDLDQWRRGPASADSADGDILPAQEPQADAAVTPRVPHMHQHQVRRLVRRPTAELPRTPQFLIRFGSPLKAEDLTMDAPSVFVESRKRIEDVVERRQALQSAPDHIAPDTPFWRVPAKKRNKNAIQWQGTAAGTGVDSGGAPADGAEADHMNTREAAERLRGIKDLAKTSKPWKAADLAPVFMTPETLDITAGSSSSSRSSPSSHNSDGISVGIDDSRRSSAVPATGEEDSSSATMAAKGGGEGAIDAQMGSPQSRKKGRLGAVDGSSPGGNLIALLRSRAAEFEKTGVDPDIKASLEEALQHHPGTERALRLREMKECAKDFETLVLEGRASMENCNALIRAQAVQGRMDAAMQTHDAMKLHGFEPDDGTFVSLLVGAARRKDAVLARRLFLKMREQLISATPKVYATLIKAHVRADDLASGFALLRKMEDERLEPDVVVYTVLIDGLVNAGKLSKAWEEFHSIRTWKLIQPDEVLFTVMIKACAKAQEAERALNMLDDMRMCGLYPTDLTYGEIIHAMATSPDHAHKAFDFFRQMKAEELPLSPFVFEKLLESCRNLGDARKAREVLQEMKTHGFRMRPEMYYHLVGLFATAMRLPQVVEVEKLQNLRFAWQVIADAKRNCANTLDWTRLLNEAMVVYINGGFANYAVDMLQQYAVFGVRPDDTTYRQLLELLGRELKDIGRFFTLWEVLPKDPQPPDEMYHLALEMALESRSAKRTCAMLEELYAAKVFPTPQLTDKLARMARNVVQVHHLVGKFIALNREMRMVSVRRETAMLQANMSERELSLAVVGKTTKDPTPEQEARVKHFEKLKKRGWFKRPWLPLGEYIATKRKGGEAYAQRHDRPRPNLLAA